MNCFKYSTDSEIDLVDRSSTHVFDSTCSHLSTFSITILKIAFERHHPPSFYFCASVRVAREIDQVSDACVRFSPSFLQFLHFLRANFDPGLPLPLSLFPSSSHSRSSLSQCVTIASKHRDLSSRKSILGPRISNSDILLPYSHPRLCRNGSSYREFRI